MAGLLACSCGLRLPNVREATSVVLQQPKSPQLSELTAAGTAPDLHWSSLLSGLF